MDIRLIDDSEILMIVPLLKILNPTLTEEIISERLLEMVTRGYKCAGAFDSEELIAICGIWELVKVYVGRHIEPDNVVVQPRYRSSSVGNQLIAWVLDYGKERGCVASELNCYITNPSGQKFWERVGYKAIGIHYQLKFSQDETGR